MTNSRVDHHRFKTKVGDLSFTTPHGGLLSNDGLLSRIVKVKIFVWHYRSDIRCVNNAQLFR